MGFSSQSGDILVRTQPTPNVLAPDLTTAGVGVLLRSGSLAINREALMLDPEIGGGRDTTDAYLGPASYAGDLEMYPRFESFPTFLRGAMGQSSSSALTAGVATHTFTPTDSGQLPFLSLYEDIGGGLQRSNYWDAVVNTLHLEADANGFLMGTAGLIARKAVLNVADVSTDLLVDQTPVAVGTSVSITYAGVTLPAKSFSLDLNNNVEDDDFRLGSFDLGDLTAKQRELTGSFSMRHATDAAYYRQASLGKATATSVGGETTKDQMVITLNSYKLIPTAAVTYQMVFTIPYVMFSPFSLDPSGDDVLENDIDFTGLRLVKATPIMTATVKNGRASVA